MLSRYNNRNIPLLTHSLFWCCYIFSFISSLVVADELDTLQFLASINKSYDSNLFRQSTNEVSDQFTVSTIGVRFDKTYALQRLKADVTYIDNKYEKSDFLNYAATNYNAAWNWSLTPNFTGILSTVKTQRQISFRDLQTPIRNLQTTTENTFRAEYSPYRSLALIAGYSEITTENSQQFNAIPGSNRTGLDYGIRYNFPSESYISFIGHRREGDIQGRPLNFALQFDTGFSDYEYDIEFSVAENGKSNVTGKLGYLERQYDNFTLRDYQAFIGNVNYEIFLTGKIKSNVGVSRNLSPFETSNSTYSLTDSFTTTFNYEISDKIQAGINFRLSKRDFDGRDVFDTSGRFDKEHSYGANIIWRPIKNLGFSLASTRSHRNSTLAQFDFDDTFTSVNVDFKM